MLVTNLQVVRSREPASLALRGYRLLSLQDIVHHTTPRKRIIPCGPWLAGL